MPDDQRVRQWGPVGAAVARLLGPYAEVVLHDPETDQVVAIWNAFSGRQAGDPSLLGELDGMAPAEDGVYGPYEKLLPDGRRLSSVSALILDADGKPELVLCVNLDRTPFDHARDLLAAFAAPVAPRPEPLFEHDWTERINEVVGGFVRDHGRPVTRLTKPDRLTILCQLEEAGVFAVRNAVPVVARALRMSRSGVYALLAEVRKT